MSDYKVTAAQQAQNNIIARIFLDGENGQKLKVISPLTSDHETMWFITYDPVSGQKFRNEIKIFEVD